LVEVDHRPDLPTLTFLTFFHFLAFEALCSRTSFVPFFAFEN